MNEICYEYSEIGTEMRTNEKELKTIMVVENGYSNNIDSLLSGGIEWVSTVAFRSLVQKLRRESRMRKLFTKRMCMRTFLSRFLDNRPEMQCNHLSYYHEVIPTPM